MGECEIETARAQNPYECGWEKFKDEKSSEENIHLRRIAWNLFLVEFSSPPQTLSPSPQDVCAHSHFWFHRLPLVSRPACGRRLVADLSLQSPRLIPRAVYVKLVMNKVALGKVFLQVLLFCPVRVIPPKLSSNISFIDHRRHHINSATGTLVKWSTSLYNTNPIGFHAVKSFPPPTVTICTPPSPPGSLYKRVDGGSAFRQNVDNLLPDYKVTHVRRQCSSVYKVSERQERRHR